MIQLIADLGHLIFPNLCVACENELSRSEKHLCAFCESSLTLTNFHLFDNEVTPVEKLFWGRIELTATYSHVFFEKNKASQNILFNLKYKNKPQLGVYFGNKIGTTITQIDKFQDVDAFIPVPLHPKKAFIRGYNQSEMLAKGICDAVNKKMDTSTIRRTHHTETQTKKSRFQRWDNVNEKFKVSDKVLNYKHVVLVDDVITTGSTIESVAAALRKKNPSLSISVVTLAVA